MLIVIAWVVMDSQVVGTWQADLGRRPKMREVQRGCAAVWLNVGTAEDLVKAHAYAGRQGYSVFVYPTSEADPLGRAKADVLRAKAA